MTTEYLKVVMGRTRLLFPAAELLAVEPIARVIPPPTAGNSMAMIAIQDATVPAVTLDEDLQPVPAHEIRRRLCAVLREDGATLGVTCDEASVIGGSGLQFHVLPACMRTEGSIIPIVAVHNGSLFSVCKTADLIRILNHPPRVHPQSAARRG
ncbi:MAG TPA: hypothetical protein VMH34_03900 [Gammaproteobacteria bacterium]|nr:hypothetical protein [Gammaproteobacteria bacterium]